MRELDNLVIKASTSQELLEQVIAQEEYFIISCASTVTKRYITKSDDEWSVALNAFVEAIQHYDIDKGSFIAYAKLVIRRRMIDYIRSRERHRQEISVDPMVFHLNSGEEDEDKAIRSEIAKQVTKEASNASNSIAEEIDDITEVLTTYGFTFMDLTTCSPHAKKTKAACAQVINYILEQPIIFEEIIHRKQLPIKIIIKNTKVPRKIVERHRKYIIAAIVILSGEYPNLAEYLQYIKDE